MDHDKEGETTEDHHHDDEIITIFFGSVWTQIWTLNPEGVAEIFLKKEEDIRKNDKTKSFSILLLMSVEESDDVPFFQNKIV